MPVSASGSTENPFRYGGKYGYYTDNKTGLILAGQRWYSPHLMRWLSRDPIGYEGGYNLYGYVDQNPVSKIDPDGLNGGAIAVGGFPSSVGLGGLFQGLAPAIGVIAPVGFGAGFGGAAAYCFFDPDGCYATFQGMCASDAKPTLDEQADALLRFCSLLRRTREERCAREYANDSNYPKYRKCLVSAQKKYLQCKKHARGMRSIL